MRILLAVLLLTSCSPPNQKPQVRIAIYAGGISNLPIHAAHALGYFDEQGLSVQVEELNSSNKVTEAVLGGSVDIGGATYDQVLQAAGMGREIQSFFVLGIRPNVFLVAAPRKTSIRQIEDLRGGTVGVTSLGSSSQNVLSLMLQRKGMTLTDVTPVAIGSSASAIAALENGKVDAAIVISLPFQILRTRHPAVTVLWETRTPEGAQSLFGVPELPFGACIASSRWLAANGDTARRVTKALARAAHWLRERPLTEVRSRLPESLRTPGSDVDLVALEITLPSLTLDGRMPPNGPAAVRDFLAKTGAKDLPADLSKTYTEKFLEAKP